jgi:hypothetical protein
MSVPTAGLIEMVNAPGGYDGLDPIVAFVRTQAAIMLLAQDKAAVPVEGCEHRVQIAIDDKRIICVLCRHVSAADFPPGLQIKGSKHAKSPLIVATQANHVQGGSYPPG